MPPKALSLLTLLLTVLVLPEINAQYTLDLCSTNSECETPRVCVEVKAKLGVTPCKKPDSPACICVPQEDGLPVFVQCTFDSECPEGEVCDDESPSGSICRSNCSLNPDECTNATKAPPKAPPGPPEQTPETPIATQTPGPPEQTPETPIATQTPVPKGKGTKLTRDKCQKTSECKSPRQCIRLGSSGKKCAPGFTCECFNIKAVPCTGDEECDEGEECFDGAMGRPDAVDDKFCVSTDSIREESPSPESPSNPSNPSNSPQPTDGVCVAAEELHGVDKVFERDFHAWVLCDAGGSCATAGHMVVWKGVGMMMKSYCDVVECEKKVMAVNSPRWRGGRVGAKTDGLVYTNFAARWETNVEERLLGAVVRLGA